MEILSAFFSDAWQRSKMPFVCACFPVAFLSCSPKTRNVSAITSDINWVPVSVMMVVERYAWRIIMSTSAFAMVLASILVTQYVNRYRENTSMAVTIAVYPFDGSPNGTMTIPKASSCPIASWDVIIIGGVSIRLSACFVRMHFLHWLMCSVIMAARLGK